MRPFRTPLLSAVAAAALVASALAGGSSPAVAAPSPDLSITNVGTNATYTQFSNSLLAYKGKTVTIRFTATEDSSLQTSFVVDDTALNVS